MSTELYTPANGLAVETHKPVAVREPLNVSLTESSLLNTESPLSVDSCLKEEWQRQALIRIKLGYHNELNLSEEAYLGSLPKFKPPPLEYGERFALPLLVEKRISWVKQAGLSDILVSKYLRSLIDQRLLVESNDPDVSEVAYAGYFNNWGQRFTDKVIPLEARKQLLEDEVGAGLLEGISLQIAYPQFITSVRCIDLIGDPVGLDRVPYLGRSNNRPVLGARWAGKLFSNFRPLVRGDKIVTV